LDRAQGRAIAHGANRGWMLMIGGLQ
jgi:hypothetical protein